MATPKQQESKAPAAAKTAQQPETLYDASEIAANSPRLFGYSVDLARAAFDFHGVTRIGLTQARALIKSFAERKV